MEVNSLLVVGVVSVVIAALNFFIGREKCLATIRGVCKLPMRLYQWVIGIPHRVVEHAWDKWRARRVGKCVHKFEGAIGKVVCSGCGLMKDDPNHDFWGTREGMSCRVCGYMDYCDHRDDWFKRHGEAGDYYACTQCGWISEVKHETCDICGKEGRVVRAPDSLPHEDSPYWWRRDQSTWIQWRQLVCEDTTECKRRALREFGDNPPVSDEAKQKFRASVKERQAARFAGQVYNMSKIMSKACEFAGHKDTHATIPHECEFTINIPGELRMCCCGKIVQSKEVGAQ